MSHKHHGNDWMSCTLCRSQRQSQMLLQKARQRQIQWPKPKEYSGEAVQDPNVYTSIDDAFSNMMQYLSSTTKNCKRYYNSCSPDTVVSKDHHHCDRFHTPSYTHAQHRNPLQMAEDVHMVVHPGTYAVTAGEWGTGTQQQTHVVRVDQGQTVNLDFVL